MAKDILLDDNDDLMIVDGDLVIGNSDQQHVSLLLRMIKGSLKSSPLTGIGIKWFLSGTVSSFVLTKLEREINIQLTLDGAKSRDVEVTKELIKITAEY